MIEAGPVSSIGAGMSVWVLSGRFVFLWVWVFPGEGGGGVRILAGVIVQGVFLFFAISSPGDNALVGVLA